MYFLFINFAKFRCVASQISLINVSWCHLIHWFAIYNHPVPIFFTISPLFQMVPPNWNVILLTMKIWGLANIIKVLFSKIKQNVMNADAIFGVCICFVNFLTCFWLFHLTEVFIFPKQLMDIFLCLTTMIFFYSFS